ncbi:MAG: YbhB/YbcL family Raf kinase inhibitor-like protein [Pseudomonadota bacterium]
MLEKLPEAMGEALGDIRAGLDKTMFHSVDLRQGMARITLSSLAFADHAPMPEKYSADGAGLSPPLHWHGIPAAAAEVVLIVEDADSPTPQPLVHAIAHGLPTGDEDDGALAEGTLSGVGEVRPLVPMGRNSLLQAHWMPPDPPPGHGVHRYVFQIFALEPGDPLPETPGRDALREAVLQRGLASGCLIGTYERPSGAITERLSSLTLPLQTA